MAHLKKDNWSISVEDKGVLKYLLIDYTAPAAPKLVSFVDPEVKHICIDKEPFFQSLLTYLYAELHGKLPDDLKRFVYLKRTTENTTFYLINEEQHKLFNPQNICDTGE